MAPASARGVALAALAEWRRGRRFADPIMQNLLAQTYLSTSDRAFATELFYGVIRHLALLDFWIGRLRSAHVDDQSRDLVRLGLYQLFCLRTPEHAAVFETVALATRKSRSFVNAVLRNATRAADELTAAAREQDLAVRTSHPQFLIDRWTNGFGAEAAAALCDWNNQPAPIYARVNMLKTTTEQFAAADERRELLPQTRNFARVATVPHAELDRGECYIQDPSTSVACELLDPQPGERVLDACAAPGGKSGLLAEMMQNMGELIACDREAHRVELLRGNLDRLGVSIARVLRQDWTAGEVAPELAGGFDRILLDAPCTNTGVMRRRVDLRWRLSPRDFMRMPAEQLAILRALVPQLKPGGTLVYSTCSIEAEENEAVVRRVIEDFSFLRMSDHRAMLPFRDGFDGAFAAKLTRAA
jgi:16S rRNA (cytosine967-C5)-methyltransferase